MRRYHWELQINIIMLQKGKGWEGQSSAAKLKCRRLNVKIKIKEGMIILSVAATFIFSS